MEGKRNGKDNGNVGNPARNRFLVEMLKLCAKERDLPKGTRLHAHILKQGLLEKNPYMVSTLISMYAKCSALAKAQQVLEDHLIRDAISWNALISGYVQKGHGHKALICFDRMQKEGISPTEVTFTCALKACAITKSIEKGRLIHDEIANRDMFGRNIVLGNTLVDMYAKCGMIMKAREVFEELPTPDVVSWSSLISGYAQHGQGHEASGLFSRMRMECLLPNEVTFSCLLKACGGIGDIGKGKQIHIEIMDMEMLKESVVLGTALLDMYAKCGELIKAERTFDEIPHRNIISWNALLSGYAQMGQYFEAVNCFSKLKMEGLSPNEATFIAVLTACSTSGCIHKGEEIHEEIVKMGFLNKGIAIGTALVGMYARCGFLEKAQQTLEEIHVRDVVVWNVLIAGYAVQVAQGHKALDCFTQMQREGVSPNEATFSCVLKACAYTGSVEKGKRIHSEIISRGFLEKNVMLATAVIDMYAKCHEFTRSQQVLASLPVRDIVSWNALISAYAQDGIGNEALDCFARVQREGLSPDDVTFTCILKVCGCMGAIDLGKQIHEKIVHNGLLAKSGILGSALVDMYVKCGMFQKAQVLLEELPTQDAVTWSALIAGYAEKGHSDEALRCFRKMESDGHFPTEVTFVCILNACSHSGKLDEAEMYYENMSKKYGITPKLEHHTCMVIAFGCSGYFDKAMSLIKAIPSCCDPSIWLTLLRSCRKWGNVEIGRTLFDRAIQWDNNLAAAYALMADIYADAGIQQDANEIVYFSRNFCLDENHT